MTPAIRLAETAGIKFKTHSYNHDATTRSYGLEAAEKLDLNCARVFKTLMVKLHDGRLAVGIIPVDCSLNLKRMAKACGAKKAEMAKAEEAERSTGYVLGGISPLAQKRSLPTWLDECALSQETILVSAGKRGLEIELTPDDLLKLTRGKCAGISQD